MTTEALPVGQGCQKKMPKKVIRTLAGIGWGKERLFMVVSVTLLDKSHCSRSERRENSHHGS